MKNLYPAVLVLLFSLGVLLAAPLASAQQETAMDAQQWHPSNDGFEYRTYPLRPTDWPDGRPAPPENCGLNAEQAQQYQCEMISYEGRPYYYYEGAQGTVHARRPAMSAYSQSVLGW
jgi:hypothetical protein